MYALNYTMLYVKYISIYQPINQTAQEKKQKVGFPQLSLSDSDLCRDVTGCLLSRTHLVGQQLPYLAGLQAEPEKLAFQGQAALLPVYTGPGLHLEFCHDGSNFWRFQGALRASTQRGEKISKCVRKSSLRKGGGDQRRTEETGRGKGSEPGSPSVPWPALWAQHVPFHQKVAAQPQEITKPEKLQGEPSLAVTEVKSRAHLFFIQLSI